MGNVYIVARLNGKYDFRAEPDWRVESVVDALRTRPEREILYQGALDCKNGELRRQIHLLELLVSGWNNGSVFDVNDIASTLSKG